jgi:hypothetical protein
MSASTFSQHNDGTPHRLSGILAGQTPDKVLMFQSQA